LVKDFVKSLSAVLWLMAQFYRVVGEQSKTLIMAGGDDKQQSTDNKEVQQNNQTAISKLKEKHKEEKVAEAHEQADADIAQDPDLSIHSPNDDLDEGETARLGDDEKLPI
jgi:gamma-glutamyl-gamma-aminobutyrate hydrolase PuuD